MTKLLRSGWEMGVLRVAPKTLPAWLLRSGPIHVPIPTDGLRPAPAGMASVETRHGDLPLLDGDGQPCADLDHLEHAIVTEQAFRARPRAYPTWVPVGVRRSVARAEHAARRALSSNPRLVFSFGGDAVGALAALARDEVPAEVWPAGRRAALVLTHDVEEPTAGRALSLARAEAALGVRATYFLVPEQWRRGSLPDALRALGHEVACHGIDHSGREAKATPAQLRAGAALLGSPPPRGYRSPRFGWAPGHANRLSPLFAYDSSRPDSRLGRRTPVWQGCGTAFPFLEAPGLVQLPVTLPTDLDLLDEGYTWPQVHIAWRAKWRLLTEAGGLGVLCTHVPAPGPWSAPLRFVEEVLADGRAWVGTAGELASFLLERAGGRGGIRPWRQLRRLAARQPVQDRRLPVVATGSPRASPEQAVP